MALPNLNAGKYVLVGMEGSGVASPAASTLIVTTDPVTGTGTRRTVIRGFINITAGTGATAIVITLKQSNGGQIGAGQTHTLAAGNSASIPFVFADDSSYLDQDGGASYGLYVAETGATANGTINNYYVEVCN